MTRLANAVAVLIGSALCGVGLYAAIGFSYFAPLVIQ